MRSGHGEALWGAEMFDGMDGPLTLFVVVTFGMIALVCLVSFPLLIYPPYTGPAVPPPGAMPARQGCDEADLLALNGDARKLKPAGVLKVKASPLKIHRPEAN